MSFFEASCSHSDNELCLSCAGRLVCDKCGSSPAWPQINCENGRPQTSLFCLIGRVAAATASTSFALTDAAQAS